MDNNHGMSSSGRTDKGNIGDMTNKEYKITVAESHEKLNQNRLNQDRSNHEKLNFERLNIDQEYTPGSMRAKVVHFIWRSIPRAVLLAMIVLIVVLFGTIKTEMKTIETEKASALVKDKPLVNTVVMPLVPRDIKDSINLPGTIEPWTQLTLKAEVHGTLA
ncbi:MAG: hypothetical protein HQK62_08960, partial [Desulfamplus sp.]|nr:hypothetical protein [Desulfamplus sp.]